MSLEQLVKTWVSLDNEIKTINENLRLLREKRNSSSDSVLTYIQEKRLENATIKISDGRLRFVSVKQQNPLSYKFIDDCLRKCISNPEQVELIMEFIKKERPTRDTLEIKRYSQ